MKGDDDDDDTFEEFYCGNDLSRFKNIVPRSRRPQRAYEQ